jgi:hypothetical protein
LLVILLGFAVKGVLALGFSVTIVFKIEPLGFARIDGLFCAAFKMIVRVSELP